MNNNKEWWNSLGLDWKVSLITNLMGSIEKELSIDLIIKEFEKSNYNIDDIINMQSLIISYKLAMDLTPVFNLKKLNDFYIEYPKEENISYGFSEFIYIYPKQLRAKVKRLDFYIPGYIKDNFELLIDFENLVEINFQNCNISSLQGIQNLKKLEKVTINQSNLIVDLSPLEDLKVKRLDISFRYVSNKLIN